jgi:hypothetical protein
MRPAPRARHRAADLNRRVHDSLLWNAKRRWSTFISDEIRTPDADAAKARFTHYIGDVRKGSDYYADRCGAHCSESPVSAVTDRAADER